MERSVELATDGAMLDGGEMAQIRASTVQQQRAKVCSALHCAASFRRVVEEWHDCEELKLMPEEKWVFVDKGDAKVHLTEWCAATTDTVV